MTSDTEQSLFQAKPSYESLAAFLPNTLHPAGLSALDAACGQAVPASRRLHRREELCKLLGWDLLSVQKRDSRRPHSAAVPVEALPRPLTADSTDKLLVPWQKLLFLLTLAFSTSICTLLRVQCQLWGAGSLSSNPLLLWNHGIMKVGKDL